MEMSELRPKGPREIRERKQVVQRPQLYLCELSAKRGEKPIPREWAGPQKTSVLA